MEWALSTKGPLSVLFACYVSKEALFCDMLHSSPVGGNRSSNLQFHRAFQDSELEDVLSFFELLYSKLLRGEGDDRLI